MSLFVVLKSMQVIRGTATGKQNTIELHVPFRDLPKLVNEEIDFIQADGDELDEINSQFINIPNPVYKRVVKWYGETAKIIYFNLGVRE